MSLILITIAFIVFVWIIHRWNNRAFVSLAYKVPSNSLQTFFGWGKIFTGKDLLSGIYNYAERYGPNCVFWMGPWPIFLSTDPYILKEILTSQNCLDKPSLFYDGISTIGGQGLITECEPIWSQHRKLLNRAFSNKILLSFLPIFHRETECLIHKIDRSVEKGEDIDFLVILRELTLKNATQTTLKRNLELTKFNSTSMSKHFEEILEFVIDVILNKLFSITWIRELAEKYIYKKAREGLIIFRELFNESLDIVQQKDTTDHSYLSGVNSILDLALNATEQNTLKLDEIEGLVMQTFFAAFETTSTTLFLVLSMLAMHPEYQEHAYEEIMTIIADDDSVMSVDQVDQLTYLDMVFNETMRILPIVPMVLREVSNENVTLSNGITLPVGQIICIDLFRLHRRKDIWGDQADDFNPDNFLPANVATRHPYSFMPFTKGHRICIGWRYATLLSKITLAKLIKTYKFSTDFKYKDLKVENHITLKFVDKPKLYLERR